MNMRKWILENSCDHPWLVTGLMMAVTALLIAIVALPSLWPDRFAPLRPIRVDTDPENMLSANESVRVFHNQMHETLGLHDIIVLGVTNDKHPQGVFNAKSLANLYKLTEYAKTLRGEALGLKDPNAGIIEADILAPSTVDNIEQGGPGEVKFEWLMPQPPASDEEALAIRDKAKRLPFLNGTLLAESGKTLAIYLPVSSKSVSNRVYTHLNQFIETLDSDDQYYITGLPVANDVFGVEMFKQMAISAPLAMLVIFILMLLFFRKLMLITAPMILAMVSVIFTMGVLIATGNTIHIMSSMIPIFIMPIAVLDSIHIISEFFERYQTTRNRRATILSVMETLFSPMLYTSLTSAAGFASLALTPIPPVQVFGLFVAIGVMYAWLLTATFIPAFVMFIPESRLANFGAVHHTNGDASSSRNRSTRFLHWAGEATYQRYKLIIALSVVSGVIAIYGIFQIRINDNPTKWFEPSHPIRVADRVLNQHFGGTYMAYLALRPKEDINKASLATPPAIPTPDTSSTPLDAAPALPEGLDSAPALPTGLDGAPASEPALPPGLSETPVTEPPAPEPPAAPATEAAQEVFKTPEALRYMEGLQAELLKTGAVGKSNSLADVVKTVHRELRDGTDAEFRIPDSAPAVAQCLMQFQSGHRPADLWHFVTPDYRLSSIWVQLKSGDNKDMEKVVETINQYVAANPAPFDLTPEWFGLTYINVIWQEKMVTGMLQSFLGSFLVVLFMMIILFRSGIWGLLSMIPLTITIGLIYGVIGLIGKDYDMPVAVLSSLTLGLAVDFAIHFLSRTRELHAIHGDWANTHGPVFSEPARAITRNVIVIAVGFLPLLAAPLVPYQTVGIFLAAILMLSGIGTLIMLPALIRLLEPFLFPKTKPCSITCLCGTCILTAITGVLVVVVNISQFVQLHFTTWTWISLVSILVLAILCTLSSRRQRCREVQMCTEKEGDRS